MKYLFYLIFFLEIGAAFKIADLIANKVKYKHYKIYNIIGLIGAIIFFVFSAKISYNGWLSLNFKTIIFGFILLCIALFSLTFIQKDFTSPRKY